MRAQNAGTISQLRSQLRDLNDNIADLTTTANRLWDRDERDPRIALIDKDIAKFERARDRLVARIRTLQAQTTRHAA